MLSVNDLADSDQNDMLISPVLEEMYSSINNPFLEKAVEENKDYEFLCKKIEILER